jgi:hypothetical protein
MCHVGGPTIPDRKDLIVYIYWSCLEDLLGHVGATWDPWGGGIISDNKDLIVQTSWSRVEDMLEHVGAIGIIFGSPLFLARRILLTKLSGAILKLC